MGGGIQRLVPAVYWEGSLDLLWVDGINSGLGVEGQKLCASVVIGVNERGEKHFLTIEDSVRESTQSWLGCSGPEETRS